MLRSWRAYSRLSVPGEWPWLSQGLFIALTFGFLTAGCSISLPFMSKGGEDEDIVTASIGKTQSVSPLSRELSPEDWRRARNALGVAMDPQGNGAPVSWDNPESGAKGTFTPVGKHYVKNDDVCRAFVASVLSLKGQEWVQGSACKASGEEWLLQDIKPWKKPS